MRIIAALIWYDEHPAQLASCIAGLSRIADHVVAVDGAFLRYPQGRPCSGGAQAETIHETATSCGLGCTIHAPETVWMGDEVEKRNAALALAKAVGVPFEDWVLTVDADETVTFASGLVRNDLAETDFHAADINFHTTTSNPFDWEGRTRRFYRLLPDMRYTATHYTIEATVGGELVFINGRGWQYDEPIVDALDLTAQVRVEHRHSLRDERRNRAAAEFALMRRYTEPWPEHEEAVAGG